MPTNRDVWSVFRNARFHQFGVLQSLFPLQGQKINYMISLCLNIVKAFQGYAFKLATHLKMDKHECLVS